MIGLMGAQGCGKSTLAKAYAEKYDLDFVETTASAIFKDMGYDPAVIYDFSTRLDIQEQILMCFDKQYAKHPRTDRAIADRTPLDMLSYTLAEAVGNSVSASEQVRFKRYMQACIHVTNKRFGVLILVQPGIPIVEREGKAAPNEAYIEHLNTILLGLSVDERIKSPHFYLPRSMTKIEERVGAVDYAIKRTMKRFELACAEAVMH